MTTDFSVLNLRPELVQAVSGLGFTEPMPIQTEIIPLMLAGSDVIGQAQTGTGKTAAFALPMLHNLTPGLTGVQGLVLVPTRELALQAAKAMAEFGRGLNVRVLAVYGGQPYSPQINSLRKGVDVVVGTPGRLLDLLKRKVLDLSQVRTLVLDEADEMLSMGFVEDINTILAETPAERQTALFSATLPPEIRRLAEKYMRQPKAVTIQGEQVTGEGIEQRCYVVNESDKAAALTRLFEMEEVTSTLVFVRTRAGTAELAGELTARGYPAEALNGDLNQEARERTLNRFRQNRINVLVATDVAARGLDIDNISHVFNVGLPDELEVYIHRIGRTGRAGKTGIAITLLSPRERRSLRQLETITRQKIVQAQLPTEADILSHREDKLVKQLVVWLGRGRCQREREIVEKMAAEGHDPLQIAAAALKMGRAEDKQRPIAALQEVVETRPERTGRAGSQRSSVQGRGKQRFEAWSPVSHEEGMVRLSLNLGKKHGIHPSDIVGAIASHANIPGYSIGKIHIQEKQSIFDVPEEFVTRVLAKTGEVRILRQPVHLQRA